MAGTAVRDAIILRHTTLARCRSYRVQNDTDMRKKSLFALFIAFFTVAAHAAARIQSHLNESLMRLLSGRDAAGKRQGWHNGRRPAES